MDKEPEPSGYSGLSDLIDIIQNFENQPNRNGANCGDISPELNSLDSKSPSIEQIQQHLRGDNSVDHSIVARPLNLNTGAVSKKPKPYIRIVEQPAPASQRFRYICEARTAGSIQGVNYTPENKTYPTVEIVGWKGEVKLLISLVTKDEPYRAHPHNLVGKGDNFEEGIFRKILKDGKYRVVLSNLGIQCTKKIDIKTSLDLREKNNVDPFKQKFAHKDQPSSIDLSAVRLCFQAYIVLPDGYKALTPVVSDPIYDKKSVSELVICRMCRCSGVVTGGEDIILLCERVTKDDIKVRFFEEDDNQAVIWESFGEFKPNDVHKNSAIAFKTPRYHKDEVDRNAKIFVQLVRPSNGDTSPKLQFEYYPNPGMRTFSRIQRKLKRKQDLEIFQQILSMDSETTATKYSCPLSDPDQDYDDDRDDEERSCSTESSKSNPLSSDTLHDDEVVAAANRQQGESETVAVCHLVGNARRRKRDDDDDDYISENGMRDMEIELEVPLINYPAADEATQTSTPIEEILKRPQLETGPRQLSTNDKITEWMRSSEFERIDSLTVENGDGDGDGIDYDTDDISPMTAYTNITITTNNCNINNNTTISTDDEKSLIDMLEQVVEVDELQSEPNTEQSSRRSTIENTPILKYKEMPNAAIPSKSGVESKGNEDIFAAGTASTQASVEIDESFDDNSTYTSLQIAFRNPIDIPLHVLRDPSPSTANLSPPTSTTLVTDENDEGLVVLTNPPAPKIKVNVAQTPPSPTTPTLRLPPRTPSPVPDEMLPPLPPKPQSRTSPEICSINSNSVALLQRYSDPGPTDKIMRKRKTEPETPALFLKRELLRQGEILPRPSPFTDICTNYGGNTWNNLDPIKTQPSSLSPNLNRIMTPSPGFSPNHLAPTPESQHRWTPSPGSQLPYYINTLSIGDQTSTGNYSNTIPNLQMQQHQQQQQQLLQQQQQQQHQQQHQQLFSQQPFTFNNLPSNNNNNNNFSPTNPFASPLRNTTSGGSITPLLPTNFGQNSNTQQSIQSLQLNPSGLSPVTLQSLPVSPISPQEQYTPQQSLQSNITTRMPNPQEQLPEQIEIDSSEEPLTTSGLIRMITSEDFLMK